MNLEHDKKNLIAGLRKIKNKLDYTINEIDNAATHDEIITTLMTSPMLANEVNKP